MAGSGSGLTNAVTAAISGMNTSANKTAVVGNNIANSETTAFKLTDQYNIAIVNSVTGEGAGVSMQTRQLVDVQGPLQTTGITTDLAIQGAGFAVVTDKFINGVPSSILLTRDLSFRKDKTNMLVNNSGHYLLAWSVDGSGNLPTTKSLISSLEGVNVTQWTAQATSTSQVSFGANLMSQQAVAGKGAGNLNILNKGVKASPMNAYASASDILYPNPATSLTQGEGLELAVATPAGTTTTNKILFGGFAQTLSFSNTDTSLVAGVGSNLAGDTIAIQYGNQAATVTRGNGATSRDVLQSIADQINASGSGANGVQAQIFDINGFTSIAIAPTNINSAVTFGGTLTFRNQVGLDDSKNIQAFMPDAEGVVLGRFATLNQLTTLLSNAGVKTSVNYDPAIGVNITLSSAQAVAFSNYQPLGKGSDFLTEFGLQQGYLPSSYDPYVSSRNMAGGAFPSHFSQNVTIYDSIGNEHNLLIAFLKTGVNQWATEVYMIDPASVNIPGRTDGLLMAGTFAFDGTGNLSGITAAPQYAYSRELSSPHLPLGATPGQTLTVGVGNTNYTYTYGNLLAASNSFSTSGTNLVGTAVDTLDITCGSTTYNIARGPGATNIEVLTHIAEQINQSSGQNAISAQLVYNSVSNQYSLNIRAVDVGQAVSFAQTGTIGTNLGITSSNDIAANSFSTLYELAEQINNTQGPGQLTATVLPGVTQGSYVLRMTPVNPALYMTFGGTSQTIGAPLGTGTQQTIAQALGLNNTSAAGALVSLTQPLVVTWSPIIGANPNTIAFSWGTSGFSNGMGQVAGNYSVKMASQNGVSTGDLVGVSVDTEGWITASFSNSLTRKIYKVPVGDCPNPNGLQAMPGNAFRIGEASGFLNLKEAGLNGAGLFVPGALEGSNVDISLELSELIFAQRQYQANSKVMTVVNKLMEELTSVFRG